MKPGPALSVLMPVYNGQEYLKPAIDSILNQDFQDFELIIVNDGSRDDSQKIIESYSDERIIAIIQENQGVARSLNNGLDIARGRYVRRHDADDISSPDSLRKQMEFLGKHPEYVMVCGQQAFMTSSGKVAKNFRVPHTSYFEGKDFKDLSFGDFRVDQSSPVVHGTACYRRAEVMRLGKYRSDFIVSEDNDLWLRLLEKHKIAVVNHCTYFMRIHGDSATQRHAQKISHFRKMLIDFSQQRRQTGSDPIMRGEALPEIPEPENEVKVVPAKRGKWLREDLQYSYAMVVDARDFKLMRKIGRQIICDGWKLPAAWKIIFFPLLGKNLVKLGVNLKSCFRVS